VDFFQAKVSQDRVRVGEDLIIPTTSVCNLGVHLLFFHEDTRLEDCVKLFCHTTSCHLFDRLQSMLNAAAWVIFSAQKYDHVTPLLQELHWPQAPQGIEYKLSVLIYRRLPWLSTIVPRRRSTSCGWRWLATMLAVSIDAGTHGSYDTPCVGDCAFYVAVTRTWTSLLFGLTSASYLPCSGASSKHYFLPEANPTSFTAHDTLFSSCAANSVFSFDVVRCTCSHFDIMPPKSVLWWMNEWMNEWTKCNFTGKTSILSFSPFGSLGAT